MKQNIPEGLKPEIVPYNEILNSLIIFNKRKFIPDTSELRNYLRNKLTNKENQLIEEIRNEVKSEYIKRIENEELKYNSLERRTTEEQRQSKLVEFKQLKELNELIPNVNQIKKNEKFSLLMSNIAELIDEGIPVEYHNLHLLLIEERFKIQLGKLGNIMMTVIGIENDKKRIRQRDMIELLLLSTGQKSNLII